MFKQLLLILAIFGILTHGSDDMSKFAPFGTAAGDSTFSVCDGDDCSSSAISFAFPFYGVLETTLFVSSNGAISFQARVDDYNIQGASQVNYPAILPFWADADLRGSAAGSVYYRTSVDPTLLSHWSSQVPDPNFHGVRALVSTWDRVGYYEIHSDKLDTFQAILITDGVNSWVFFNYGQLQWAQADSYNQFTGHAQTQYHGFGNSGASVGFAAGDKVRYVQTNTSLSSAVVNTTNFVTLVSGSVITIGGRCGNGVVDNGEQCDGGSCCTANCTFSNTVSCFCGRQNLGDGEMGYYCNANGGFYQCVGGDHASQSKSMNCGRGTHCGCGFGQECSCHLTQSPCVTAGTTQSCSS